MSATIAIIIICITLAVNIYLFKGINAIIHNKKYKVIFRIVYWIWTIPLPFLILAVVFVPTQYFQGVSRSLIMTYAIFDFASKVIVFVFFALDDIIHVYSKKTKHKKAEEVYSESRKQFLKKAGLAASIIPMSSFTFGILKGAHDYQWRKVQIPIKGLPSAFHGLRIGQLSDIHSGSFKDPIAVQGGIDMFMAEKPDLVFFTGDIVNDNAQEMKHVFDVFKKVEAPLGVYSILGNHDYGDYSWWINPKAKADNFQGILDIHESLNWKLLRNENDSIQIGNDKLSIIGIENWGASSRFPKYGDIQKAKIGVEDIEHRILLSHDPSFWDAQVRPDHPDIMLTLSGHTHGFQFGIETPFFRWSPAQYLYKQWAGLYKEGNQFIYVNRGYGYIGYPGRIGMPPELTMIELVKA